MLLIPLRDGQIDLQQQRVTRNDTAERLTDREVELLRYLSDRAGQVVPRAEIFTEVWGYAPNVVSRAVDATMRRLRKKIEVDPSNPIHLFSTYGQGYRFEYLEGKAPETEQPLTETNHAIQSTLLHQLHLGAAETRLFGRRNDVAQVLNLYDQGACLVTVMATGGMGKTRLAEEVGRLLVYHGTYPGGVWFCDLVEARTPAEIIQTVSTTLNCPTASGFQHEDAATEVGRGLNGLGAAFVVLDNFEQIAEFAAETVGIWTQLAPEIRFMVTSRQRLALEEEHVYELKPLAKEEAIDLFLDRARAINPSFAGDGPNRDIIESIVKELEGIPLALQLAAGRARLLSAKQIHERLSRRFRLLRKGAGVPEGRQSTMRAAIDWSWNLLDEAERMVLKQVSVFRGGFTLESAEAVVDLSSLGPKAPWLDEVLQALADKSMLFVRAPEQTQLENRICTFDSIRYYALEKLEEAGDVKAAQERHALFFVSWLNEQNRLYVGDLAKAIQISRQEVDNCQIAFERLIETNPSTALTLALELDELLQYEGWYDIGLSMMEQVEQKLHHLTPLNQAKALELRSKYLTELKRLPEARASLNQALERLPTDTSTAVRNEFWLRNARLLMYEKNYIGVEEQLEQLKASAILAEGMQAKLLTLQAEVHLRKGNMDQAAGLFDKAWQQGDKGVAAQFRMRIRSFQGLLRCLTGDLAGGRVIISEMHTQRRKLGKQTHIAVDLDNLGQIDLLLGDTQSAAIKFQESVAIWHRAGHDRNRRGRLISLAIAHQTSGEPEAAMRAIDSALAGLDTTHPLWRGAITIQSALLAANGNHEEARQLWQQAGEHLSEHSPLSPEDVQLLERCHHELPEKETRELLGRPELKIRRKEADTATPGLDTETEHLFHFILLEHRLGLPPYSNP